ncbi:transposase [Microcoleus vaginatus]|uniref:transposase n=1 Tax=Microcoleus vaginatus TaxID=119532 RepID=UPI001F6260AF|nr:hypothetical protein D0A37_12405 [Microcoleus vaginatus HSN003]
MDNLPVHNAESVNFLMVSIGFHVKFLPRYSPDLSRIELYWAKVKAIFRSEGDPPSNFIDEAITKALNAFTDENAWPSFHHSGLF